jgi:oligosaccharide repeat unit polymerase
VFLVFNIVFLLNYISDDILVFVSFFIIFLLSVYNIVKYVFLKDIKFFELTFWFFTYLFLFFAPYLQTYYKVFPNTLPYNPDNVVITNIVVIIFLIIYQLTRKFSTKKCRHEYNIKDKFVDIEKAVFYFIFIINVITLIFVIKNIYINKSFLTNRGLTFNYDSSISLLMTKFLFNLPVFNLIYLSVNKSKFKRIEWNISFLLSIITFLLIQNPLTVGRNQFGVTYLSIFLIFYNKRIKNFELLLIYLIAFIMFPIIGQIVHNRNVIVALNNLNFNYLDSFKSLDFDAWANIMATILYVKQYGITYFNQLLGSILFFIPRKFWIDKPISTGHLIGNYLIEHYDMWFNNLSNPLISEGYINFGIIGVILFALLLGIFNKIIDNFKKENISVYVFVSVYLIFLLRGDLMSSFAYLIGLICAIYIFPYIINHIIPKFNHKHNNYKEESRSMKNAYTTN